MPPKKQYVKVKRVSFRDVFLLSRVDLMDGKRFRLGEVVAACAACRHRRCGLLDVCNERFGGEYH